MITYIKNQNYEDQDQSRYKIYRQIGQGKDSYLETFNQREIPETDEDIYYIVPQSDENRLDLVAYRYYNDASLWWVIAIANKIIDPFVVSVGQVLRIPSVTSIYSSTNEILQRRGADNEY